MLSSEVAQLIKSYGHFRTLGSRSLSLTALLNFWGKANLYINPRPLVGSFFWIPWSFSWKLSFSVVLGTLDGDLKNEFLCPSRFFGGKFRKNNVFQTGDHRFWPKFFICGAILTSKRSILTNSAMRISSLTFILTLNIFLSMNSRWRPQTT